MYIFKCIEQNYWILYFISVCISALLKLNNAVSMETLQVRCTMFTPLCRNNNSHWRIQHKPFVLQIESQRRSVLHLPKCSTVIRCPKFTLQIAEEQREFYFQNLLDMEEIYFMKTVLKIAIYFPNNVHVLVY